MTQRKLVKIISFDRHNTEKTEATLSELLSEGWRIASTSAAPAQPANQLADRLCPFNESISYGMPQAKESNATSQKLGFVILEKAAD